MGLEVLPGSLNPRRLSAETGSDGIASFSFRESPEGTMASIMSVWDRWWHRARGEWDEYQGCVGDGSAGSRMHGVSGRETSVADADRGNSARLRLRRSGPDDRALSVRVELVPGPHAATVGKEFRFTTRVRGTRAGDGRRLPTLGRRWRIPRAAGVLLLVNPIRENVRSGTLVKVRVLPAPDTI